MARCQCGGDGCNCVVIAGENAEVTGAGSTLNPYVVSAVIECDDVRPCLSAGDGIAYDASTGVITACPSADMGNNLTYGSDGCLFVPTGAATVSVGCGLQGDGSGSAPVEANVADWPFSCGISANGGGVYCDPSTGWLKTDPPFRARYREVGINDAFTARTVPSAETTVDTISVSLANPDPCRAAFVIVHRTVDVDFNLPANGGAAASGINGDDLNYMRNSGSSAISAWHGQHSVMHNITIPAGGNQAIPLNITVGRGAGGATYARIQATIRIWLFSIPLS
ncbi:hypothetical protein [Streptomyces griseoruber]|uniref:hypothetical protein n=1 Tax=Streptomyces griseoruber TaxID=1943 RepID=UPI0037A1B9DE